jgi:hypothetical protein
MVVDVQLLIRRQSVSHDIFLSAWASTSAGSSDRLARLAVSEQGSSDPFCATTASQTGGPQLNKLGGASGRPDWLDQARGQGQPGQVGAAA